MVQFREIYESATALATHWQERRNLHILERDIREVIFRRLDSVMAKPVVMVSPETSVREAAALMLQHSLSCVVVVRSSRAVGILTERDFVRKVGLSEAALAKSVREVMSESVYGASPDTTLFEAHQIMATRRFRKLPVVQENAPIGMVTQTDIVRAMDRFGTHALIDSLNSIHVWQVMSEQLVTVDETVPLGAAKDLMQAKDVSCVLATREGTVSGIVTEKDFVSECVKNISRLQHYRVVDIMKSPVVSIPSSLQLFEANHYMLEKGFRRFLVTKEGVPAGIVTQTDIAAAIYRFLDDLLKRIEAGTISGLRIDRPGGRESS
jgi:signal-transduction protein with cAMP-binding, CBS, and nucleotidyltransferase domain